MRKFLVLLLIAGWALAQETKIDAYRIGYADGYEKGKQEGIEEGFRLARELFKKIYEEKLQEYKEIEAGKLLIKEKRISYPRVYLIGNRVVVEGCKLMTAYDDLLAKIPERPSFLQPKAFEVSRETSLVPNADEFKPARFEVYKVKVKVDNEDALRNLDVIYFKDSVDNTYTVYFKNKEDKEYFCRRLGQCLEK